MIKIDMDKNISISDDLPKQIHDNQIEVTINEYPDGSREISIQPWIPCTEYSRYYYECEDLKEKVKDLEEQLDKANGGFKPVFYGD